MDVISHFIVQHFPYEDYDEWMWGNYGPWGEFSKERRVPDVLVVGGLGLHSCKSHEFHSHLTLFEIMIIATIIFPFRLACSS